MSGERGDAFVRSLLEWYEEHGRHDLPWRDRDASPFEVLVAELMLQQTSAEQVLWVFEDFVDRYPGPKSIVAAPDGAIAEEIEPLGLRKRSEYFERASEQIVERHGGEVPDTRSELLDLHGVGEYTAASVLAHAYEKDIAAVDTNVARILSRAFGLDAADDPSATENWELAERIAPPGRCGDYLHALIDFGAAVCTASDPNCASCPLEDSCEYRTDEGQ